MVMVFGMGEEEFRKSENRHLSGGNRDFASDPESLSGHNLEFLPPIANFQ